MFTALSAMVVAVAMTPGLTALAATPDTELGQAYEWARSREITTMDSYESANMYGAVTRAQLAKMLSNWAMNEKGLTPDESLACEFTDIDSVKGDLHDFIKTSCQLGLMGQGITAFRPYDKISRAEFGTALSRALWGDENNGEIPYYAKHLNALKSEGIMTQIDNPEGRDEIRGYVMLMLMRASEEKVDCTDADIMLVCLDPELDVYKECPAACREANNNEEEDNQSEDGKVKAGDLAVKSVENKWAKVFANKLVSELDTLTFKANEDITLNSVTLERYGLSTSEAIEAIWLEDEDGNEVTAKKSISTSKDTVTLSLKKGYKEIWKGASFIIVVQTASGSAGDLGATNIGFKVTDVDSSAKNLDLSDYAANLYDFVDYAGNGVQVEFKGTNTTKTYNYEAGKSYEVAKMRVYATKAAVSVDGFTLTNEGNLELDDYIEDVEVLVDGTALKNVKASLKNDELKITFDAEEIAINKNKIFTIKVTLSDEFDQFGDTIQFKLDEPTDLNVTETKNNVRVEVTAKTGSFVSPTTYKFNGAKINLNNEKLDKTIEAAQGSSDVTVAKGKIVLGGQAIRINELTLTPDHEDDIDSVKLVIDGDDYEATKKNGWKVSKIVIEEDATIEVKVDVANDAVTGHTVKFSIGNGNAIFSTASLSWLVKYDTNGDVVEDMLGSISVSALKVQEAKGSLTNNSKVTKQQFTVRETSDPKTIFDGTFTAKKQDTRLNNVKIIKSTGDLAADDSVTFHVYIDGDEVATFDWADDADFSEIVVEAGKSVSVKVDAVVYASTGLETLQYKLQLKWYDNNDNDITTSAVNMIKMSFVDAESITVTTNSAMRTKDVILTDSDQEIAAFIVKPGNKSSKATVSELRFDVSDYTADDASFDASTANADDYFEVKFGKNDTLDVEFDTAGNLVAEDINKEIEWETTISIIYKKDLVAKKDYDLELTYANEALGTSSRTFSRYAVDALVRVASQAWEKTSFTKYTFDIEYSANIDSETIESLQITYADGLTGKVWNNVVEGETYTTTNVDDASDAVKISYTAGGTGYDIEYKDYPDYFKVAGNEYVIRYSK